MSNSRFKFRVFDNSRGEYVRNSHYDRFFSIQWDGRLWETEYREPNDSSMTADASRYIVEQCTGLRDRRGKLIYEGDVVFVYNPLTDAQNACVVKWVDNEACYICEYLHPDNVQRGCEFASATGTYLDGSYCEIGGNIHEVKHE